MWHDPDDRLQKAIDRYEDGDGEAARTMLRGLERLGVISPRIDLYLGHCHLDDDRPRAALRRYHRCVSLSPSEVSAWIGIALCHGRFGRLDRALEVLRHAATLDPQREEIHCHLVHCYALGGDVEQAEAHARIAQSLDPQCPHVHRHLAIAHLIGGHAERALHAWREVLSRAPDHPEADVGLARCHATLGRRLEARRHYLRALRGPFAADAHAGLGDLAWTEGRLEDAAAQYHNAVQLDASHDEARLRLAECLGDTGRLAEAWSVLQALKAAWEPSTDPRAWIEDLGDGPGDPEVAGLAARLLRGMGRSGKGFRLLRQLCERAPEKAGPWTQLGRYLLSAGHPRWAIPALRRARRRDAGNRDPGCRDAERQDGAEVPAARYLARALGRTGRRREAVRVLAETAHHDPYRSEIHLDLGAALLARGRVRGAERALTRGIQFLPEQSDLWAALAELAFEGGRRRAARRRLREALRHDPRHGHSLALLVRWLLDRGEYRRAVHAARAAQRVLPADHAVVKDHGRALLLCGRAREASLPLRRYVLQVPSDPEGYHLLGRALEAVGDASGARSQRQIEALVGALS